MADRDIRRKGVKNQVEGAADEFKGKVRGDVGDAVDDHSEHLKGRIQEGKGKVQRKIGETQERIANKD